MKAKDNKNNLFGSMLLWFLIGFLTEVFQSVFKIGRAADIYGNNFIITSIFRGIFTAVVVGIPYYFILRKKQINKEWY